ncbi:MAG TPA: response regulator [Acidimicrobiales bacterium]|nr:response regulator [Acidimicrobiales bacterium]
MTAHAPVLVVDDRPDNLVAMRALLSSLPCRVVEALSGPEALKCLLQEEFALVLLDVQMPGLDGYETARHIKMRERTRALPIIFLSAIDTELHHQLQGYGTGAVDFIPKPVMPEIVLSKVRVFLELYEQAHQIEEQRAHLASQVEHLRRAREALVAQADELARSNAELERFTAAVSHELVEPLQLASGFLDLLAGRHRPKGAEARLMLDKGRASVARAIERVDQLLDYAALSTDAVKPGPVDLEAVLTGALEELAGDLDSSGGRVTADPLPTVWGDQWQLQALLVELLANALEHAGAEPDVHVGLSRRDSRWVVTVQDTGVGADPEVLAGAFDLLHGPGGVGLARCRSIVERHGGTIWVDASPGAGTSISFSLTPHDDEHPPEEGPG